MSKKRKPLTTKPRWEDLDVIHSDMYGLLGVVVILANAMASINEAELGPENLKSLASLMRTCTKTTTELREELLRINQKHSGKKGDVADGDDNIAVLAISTEYDMWHDNYMHTLLPAISDIQSKLEQCKGVVR